MRESAEMAIAYARRRPHWIEDQAIVDAIAKRVGVVTEIAKYQYPVAMRSEAPEIEWDKIAGMRDRLVHEYWRLDLQVLRKTVEDDLPQLCRSIDFILAREGR